MIIPKPSKIQESKEKLIQGQNFYIETLGCQMNFSDTEIIHALLKEEGMIPVKKAEQAEWIFLNTCSIRDKAEQTARNKILNYQTLKRRKKSKLSIGVLGCMAERLKKQFLEEEKIIDLVVGPDAYKSLPELMERADQGNKVVNTLLSREETYDDILPIRYQTNGVSAFISIMRGCDNMCSFCVVPFTRGRERSRSPYSILREMSILYEEGYREVTLLGQNVDSYLWSDKENNKSRVLNYTDLQDRIPFAQLLNMIAQKYPSMRIRFSTSHPKDITQDVLYAMKYNPNIARHIHLPVQSGSTTVLSRMKRGYTREEYLDKIYDIRKILGDSCAISSDIMTGFCGETQKEHQDTIDIMKEVKYDHAYMFTYSERPGTLAQRKYKDDITQEIKKQRLQEIIQLQQEHAKERNLLERNTIQNILIEGDSKRSAQEWQGRNTGNKMVVFPKDKTHKLKPGDIIKVRITDCTSATLKGEWVEKE
ncbi:MAG: tRNA (N6-isopentenyl adenosine(37)-C2)-methylthiotransferase MiaB [Cytophagales bacterium]|nr:tRNA (N6-isopentenyl adenosine(37)-C2)-methylthiotransferase MiaB [Cytophagales bacterium]